MSFYNELINKEERLSLVGLGYVGMPIAVAFAQKGIDVIGFDLNKSKIDLYKSGIDPTKEVGDDAIKNTAVHFTSDEKDLQKAKFHIVAVPTPVNTDHTPDLTPVIGASEIVGRNLTKGSYVVFESTVYPGCTEDVCVPILEKESGLKCGEDFKVGYSPKRIVLAIYVLLLKRTRLLARRTRSRPFPHLTVVPLPSVHPRVAEGRFLAGRFIQPIS